MIELRWHSGDYARQGFTLLWNDGTSAIIGASKVEINAVIDSSSPTPSPNFVGTCNIVDETKGTVNYLFKAPVLDEDDEVVTPGEGSVPGMYKYWFKVTYADGTTKSVPSGDVQWLFIYA